MSFLTFSTLPARQLSRSKTSAFSLVEVTLALGIASFCLVAVLGLLPTALKTQQASTGQTIANQVMTVILADLRADVRLPPGQASKENKSGFGLHGHWLSVSTPDTLYFTNQATIAAGLDSTATFRAKITYLFPPVQSTSVARIIVSWPAQVDPATSTPSGSIETFIAVNR